MSNELTRSDLKELARLGKAISRALACDINGTGIPPRSERFDAVNNMVKYIELHDYEVMDMAVFRTLFTKSQLYRLKAYTEDTKGDPQ
mgnify:CR=1 FL=1